MHHKGAKITQKSPFGEMVKKPIQNEIMINISKTIDMCRK
jgi:hypothetical protein